MLLLVLAACAGPADIEIPVDENPPIEQPTDPDPDPTDPEDPDGPAEPGIAEVTLQFPEDVSGLPVYADGTSAIERLVIHYWPTGEEDPAALVTLEVPGHAVTIELVPGEQVDSVLPAGEYELEVVGYGSDPEIALAYGRMTVNIGPGAEVLELALEPVLGGAELLTHDLLSGVRPGDLIRFELLLRAAAPDTFVPLGSLDVVYEVEPASGFLMKTGADGLTLEISGSALAEFEIAARISGPGIQDGALVPEGSFVTERQITVQSGEPDNTDWQPPELEFDPIDIPSAELTGRVEDDRGVAVLRVYAGQSQIGSSAPNEQSGNVAAVSFVDEGTWSMPWQAPAGTSHLRAVATDVNGNRTTAYRSTNVVPPADTGDLSNYTTLSSAAGTDTGPDDFDLQEGFCPANEFRTPGQGLQAVGAGLQAVGAGLQAVGAVGGVFLAPTDAFGDTVTHARDAIGELRERLNREQQPAAQQVVLLVVDDFGPSGNVHYLWPTLHATPESLLSVTENAELTHGAMVAQHSVEMLLQLGYRFDGQPRPRPAAPGLDPYEVMHWYDPDHGEQAVEAGTIVLQYVNINGMDTSGIASAIRAHLDHHREGTAAEAGITRRFVVNMSFVILPCAVTDDLASSGINNFEDYVAAVAAVNGVAQDDAGGAVTDVSAEDALAAYLACPYPDGQSCAGDANPLEALVHVASSGNFGVEFELYPAAYANVISVGALDVLETQPSRYSATAAGFSNPANVLAPGAMFRLVRQDGNTIAYAGTSFAAPIVSVFLVHDMGQQDRCRAVDRGVPGVGDLPPVLSQVDGLHFDEYGTGRISALDHCYYAWTAGQP